MGVYVYTCLYACMYVYNVYAFACLYVCIYLCDSEYERVYIVCFTLFSEY